MIRAIMFAAVLGACGADSFTKVVTDAGNTGADGAIGCTVVLTFDPAQPVAAPGLQVRAIANVDGGQGVLGYQWNVMFGGSPVATTFQAADHSQIDFPASVAGVYNVSVSIDGGSGFCPMANQNLNVAAQGANVADYRLRVVPPATLAPPQETIIQISGGANYARDVALDPGIDLVGMVTTGATGAAAYLRFIPPAAPNAFVETFSATDGTFETRLLGQNYNVLVVPAVPGLAPEMLAWTPGTQTLTLGAGTVVTGTVKDPTGTALAGAMVQLASNGVPSTLATTLADGSFSVRTTFSPGAPVAVTVQPPPNHGLPRLDATATFDLTQAMQIRYAASVTTCDLAATPIKRGGTNQANAQVTIVGTLAAIAGTVTAGAAANATGTVRIAASADGTGKLPSTLVPRAPLTAVVAVVASDLAVAAIDTSTCAAQTITAQPMTLAAGAAQDSLMNPLAGVQIEATPAGVLAAAGEPPITAISGAGGAFSLPFAAGGFYDVRISDPAGRGAPLVLLDVDSTGIPAVAALPLALEVSGTVSVSGNANPIEGASVQILCASCSGIDATRPIAETATDITSHYAIAVPDPGTM